MTDEKDLRYSIMKIATGKHKWTYEEFHDLMNDWGFGTSLRALSRGQLFSLRNQLLGITEYNVPEQFRLDDQGKYMYSVMKKAGWNMHRVNMYCIKRFHKTHWNILTVDERRAVITMLKNYCKRKEGVQDAAK